MKKVYISDDTVRLTEYIDAEDDAGLFACWQDEDVRRGYNGIYNTDWEKFTKRPTDDRSRWTATIERNIDGAKVGFIFLSPEDSPPDLAIIVKKEYRGKGYGTRAFSMGLEYCFNSFGFDSIYAGCYPENKPSMAMLRKCGFKPHPEGNIPEKHYITGEDITQFDFVKYR